MAPRDLLGALRSPARWRDALRPRRALLPALAYWSLWALLVLHRPVSRVNYSGHCNTLRGCRRQVLRELSRRPRALAGYVALHLLAVVVVYALAVGTVGALGWRLDLRERAPRLFAPDDSQFAAVAAACIAALAGYVAGTVGAAYSTLGATALYLLYAPPLVVLAGAFGSAPEGPVLGFLPEPVTFVLALGFVAALPALEVAWLYLLGHGAVRVLGAGRSRDGPG